jgi:hypothetical protein
VHDELRLLLHHQQHTHSAAQQQPLEKHVLTSLLRSITTATAASAATAAVTVDHVAVA